jgi:MFS transporter, DHA1 family, multidrug resistance protein
MTSHSKPARKGFIVLVALLTAMVAMSIDAMLPALGVIAGEFGVSEPNQRQHIITMFFLGMTIGTLIYGPVSDSTGRKPAIFVGLGIYLAGTLLAMFSTSFSILLAGRFLQGLGAAGPRIVSIAMVRDGQAGAAMARIMSFVMSVFMLVPILAPSFGQIVLLWGDWRMIFVGFLVMAAIAAALLAFRQEETLPPERRRPIAAGNLMFAAREFFRFPVAWGYTIAVGMIFGAFISYLGSSEQIFGESYEQHEYFALWFGGLAISIALAMILNARLVMKLGMRTLTKYAVRVCVLVSAVFLVVAILSGGHPPLLALGAYLFVAFFCCGILFGNYSAMALEPVGHIAGMASALNGTISSLIAILLGGFIGQLYDGTVIPLVGGYLGLSFFAMIVGEIAERLKVAPAQAVGKHAEA